VHVLQHNNTGGPSSITSVGTLARLACVRHCDAGCRHQSTKYGDLTGSSAMPCFYNRVLEFANLTGVRASEHRMDIRTTSK